MTAEQNLQLLHAVMSVARQMEDDTGLNFTPQPDGTIVPWVLLNDVFGWACSDAEDITPENLPLLLESCREVGALYDPATVIERMQAKTLNYRPFSDASVLFACKVRQEKPFRHQGRLPVHFTVEPLIDGLVFAPEVQP